MRQPEFYQLIFDEALKSFEYFSTVPPDGSKIDVAKPGPVASRSCSFDLLVCANQEGKQYICYLLTVVRSQVSFTMISSSSF